MTDTIGISFKMTQDDINVGGIDVGDLDIGDEIQ